MYSKEQIQNSKNAIASSNTSLTFWSSDEEESNSSHESLTTDELIHFIDCDTTVEAFYNYVTSNESNFNYDFNRLTTVGQASLMQYVCYRENIALAKALIKAGLFVNHIDDTLHTPLSMAFQHNDLELIQLLIENGGIAFKGVDQYIKKIDKELRYHSDDSILNQKLCIVKEYLSQEHIQRLSVEILLNSSSLRFAANTAIENKDVEALNTIFQSHLVTPKNCFNSFEKSAIRSFAEEGQFEMVKLLVKYGAEIIEDDGCDASGITTAMAARNNNHHDIADYLENVQTERYRCLKEIVNEELNQNSISISNKF